MGEEILISEKLSESVGSLTGSKLDRESCVLRGVRLCGFQSKNGRDYDRGGLRRATPLYENLPVYVNHPGPSDMRVLAGKGMMSRDVRDKFGAIRNVRWDDRLGPVGDLHYNGGHPLRDSFEWAANNDPSFYALSHNAEGKSRATGNGRRLVESITQIHSVDLVDRGATTGSLHEAEMVPMNWRDQLGEAVAAIFKDESLTKEQVGEKLEALVKALHDAPDADGEPGAAGGDMPQPAEAMESVRVAYPSDPNVAVLLECVGSYLAKEKRSNVAKWAKDKGVPTEKLTESVLDALVALDEPLREGLITPLRTSNGVKAAVSQPVPAAKAKTGTAKKPSLEEVWG